MRDKMTLSQLANYLRVDKKGLRHNYIGKGLIKASLREVAYQDKRGVLRRTWTYVVTREALESYLKQFNPSGI